MQKQCLIDYRKENMKDVYYVIAGILILAVVILFTLMVLGFF